MQYFSEDNTNNLDAERFYFLFNFDKLHWVGFCVDCTSSFITVLDCNPSLHTDGTLVNELTPIAKFFPYLINQAGRNLCSKDSKPFTVKREKGIPQNGFHPDFIVTYVLLMQAHAIAGLEVCRCLTPEILPTEAQRLEVMLYEENCEWF